MRPESGDISDVEEGVFDIKISEFDQDMDRYLSADSFLDMSVDSITVDTFSPEPFQNPVTSNHPNITQEISKIDETVYQNSNKTSDSPLPDIRALNAAKKQKELEALAEEWGCSLATAELMWKKKKQHQSLQRKAEQRASLKDPGRRFKMFQESATKNHHSHGTTPFLPPIVSKNNR